MKRKYKKQRRRRSNSPFTTGELKVIQAVKGYLQETEKVKCPVEIRRDMLLVALAGGDWHCCIRLLLSLEKTLHVEFCDADSKNIQYCFTRQGLTTVGDLVYAVEREQRGGKQ